MKINYTTILESRFDAPFVGTLIAGRYCSGTCKGCFNQHLKDMPVQQMDHKEIIDWIVNDNPFSEGIILAGLEWLDGQYEEAYCLLSEALAVGLKAMLYTRLYADEVQRWYPDLMKLKGLYIKCGPYHEDDLAVDYSMYGVPLASKNQYIIQVNEK